MASHDQTIESDSIDGKSDLIQNDRQMTKGPESLRRNSRSQTATEWPVPRVRSTRGVKPRARVFVIGGNAAGLAAAFELTNIGLRHGLSVEVIVIERGHSDNSSATSRAGACLHATGQHGASHDPYTAHGLQQAAHKLYALAPDAFAFPLSIVFEHPGIARQPLTEVFDALDIKYRAMSRTLLEETLSTIKVPPNAKAYIVGDGVIDVTLLTQRLANLCAQNGVKLVKRAAIALRWSEFRATAIELDGEELVPLGTDDEVLLANGPWARPLMARSGIAIKGLRIFQSHILATKCIAKNVLIAAHARANAIPHFNGQGGVTHLVGGYERCEIDPAEDAMGIMIRPSGVKKVLSDAEEYLGLELTEYVPYGGLKAEYSPDPKSNGSQAEFVGNVETLDNVRLLLPGKLTNIAAAATRAATEVLRGHFGDFAVVPRWRETEVLGNRHDVVTTRAPIVCSPMMSY